MFGLLLMEFFHVLWVSPHPCLSLWIFVNFQVLIIISVLTTLKQLYNSGWTGNNICNIDGKPLMTLLMFKYHKTETLCCLSMSQVSVPTSVSYVRKLSHRDALWSPIWGKFMESTNNMPTAKDVPRSLCVKTVVIPQAALMNTFFMWGNVTLVVLLSAGTTAARPMRIIVLHLQSVNLTLICCTHPLHTTCRAQAISEWQYSIVFYSWMKITLVKFSSVTLMWHF